MVISSYLLVAMFDFALKDWRIWRKFQASKVLKPLRHKTFSVHRLHSGEQQHVANRAAIRQQHDHAVDAVADAACGGHTDFQSVCWAFSPAGGDLFQPLLTGLNHT